MLSHVTILHAATFGFFFLWVNSFHTAGNYPTDRDEC